jgi:hypothetical protein
MIFYRTLRTAIGRRRPRARRPDVWRATAAALSRPQLGALGGRRRLPRDGPSRPPSSPSVNQPSSPASPDCLLGKISESRSGGSRLWRLEEADTPRSAGRLGITSLQERDLDQLLPLDRMKGSPLPLIHTALSSEQETDVRYLFALGAAVSLHVRPMCGRSHAPAPARSLPRNSASHGSSTLISDPIQRRPEPAPRDHHPRGR